VTVKPNPRHEEAPPPGGLDGAPPEPLENSRQDDLLDEALKETFPASDPVSVYRLT
jgi:hypothetical protein